MLKKSILAVSLLMCGSASANWGDQTIAKPYAYESKINEVVSLNAENATNHYFVQLRQMPAAFVKNAPRDNSEKLVFHSKVIQDRVSSLKEEQAEFLTAAKILLGKQLNVQFNYTTAFNGFSIKMTEQEAKAMVSMPQVLKVIRQVEYKLHTEEGPDHIGAKTVWSATPGVSHKGEGVVVGIIDSGINTDHPSFAALGGDGYTHSNPKEEYFGDCKKEGFEALCNDKLIGVYSYESITATFGDKVPHVGEDFNGHGSHVASTAAGNVLRDLPYYTAGNKESHDGNPIVGSNIPEMSGVAPHANIVSFQVCGHTGGCNVGAMVKAVEDAIEIGVDVINMSIGPNGEGPHPWLNTLDMAYLAANEAGIFASISAGNSGSGANTVGHLAPWYTVVANATHGRYFGKTLSSSINAETPFNEIEGTGMISSEITGELVYAGAKRSWAFIRQCNFDTDDQSNLPDMKGKVVLCDRGGNSLYEKALAVQELGGVGVVIRNFSGSATALYSINYPVPGIQIDEQDGKSLKEWMDNISTPEVTISAGMALSDDANANILNPSSSRGPYSDYPQLMVPHVAAPGTDIYAAYSDFMPFSNNPAPSDFSFLSGTSMAAPHVAGAAALLSQVRPDWSASQMQSALMMTANPSMLKEDRETGADVWDRGSGMIRVDQAVNSPLILDITQDEYLNSDPAEGNDFSQLNTAYIVEPNCAGICTFGRTFTATEDATWRFGLPWSRFPPVKISFSPETLEVKAGETYEVEITAEVLDSASDDWYDSQIELTSSNASVDKLLIPIRVKPLVAIVPKLVQQDYYFNEAGFDIESFMFRRPEMISFTNGPLIKGQNFTVEAAQDSDVDSEEEGKVVTPFNDLSDGVAYFTFENDGNSPQLDFYVSGATNKDTDLFVGFDSNYDGKPQEVERLCVSAGSANIGENCSVNGSVAGTYWVLVWNYSASDAVAEQDGDIVLKDKITVDVVNGTSDTLLPFNAIKSNSFSDYLNFPVSVLWSGELENNQNYYGEIKVFESDYTGTISSWGSSRLVVSQKGAPVMVTAEQSIKGNEISELIISFSPNTLSESLNLTTSITLAEGFELAQNVEGVSVNGNTLTVSKNLAANQTTASNVDIPIKMTVAMSGEFIHKYTVTSNKSSKVFEGKVQQINTNKAPLVTASASETKVVEGENFILSVEAVDNDSLTYQWRQTSGAPAFEGFKGTSEVVVTAPSVEENHILQFEVLVSDGEFEVIQTVKVTVEEKSSGGGILWLLLCLPLIFRVRKI
ncbi:S8 family serine peptidase [Litorilituus lipolyticus]|uniref:GlyGly-CTERM sorting domain-containing protein n=1 Tax=Litorilituus lipolyticus TaxID=2491017 RepID=A0A502L3Y5_9GAMM|nr:S8 family serine peptidase [Litorilituus lipolyticus]TPH17115.1 hypothetical protein EPA86_05380 [Litorilituus lipolyticus]